MATNDNYISIAMGLNVSDLKAGIAEANKQIQLANSEFKRASSEMDDWTKSTEGLQAKITQLSSVLDAQKKKLAGLEAEYNNLDKSSASYEEQARRLKVQINNQASVVNKTERELGNYEESLEKAENGSLNLETATLRGGKAIDKMEKEAEEGGSSLSKFGKVAGGIGKAVLGLGTAVVGLGAGFLATASSTREFRNNMAKLETGFTEAGFSAEQSSEAYTQLYGVLGDTGKATETASHLAQLTNNQKELNDWVRISTGVYATFGDSLPIENLAEASNETAKTGKITGGLADALNWAGVSEEEFQAKLDATSSEQERQALITETLNDLYGESADKFKELNKDIIASQEADAKLSQAMADLGEIAEPILTALKLLLVDLLDAVKPFVELMGEGLVGAMNGVEGSTDKLVEGLSGLIDNFLNKIADMIPMIIDVILELVPKIVDMIPKIVDKIAKVLADNIDKIIAGSYKLFSGILRAIPQILVVILKNLPSIITGIVKGLMEGLPEMLKVGADLFKGLWDGMKDIGKKIVDWVKDLGNNIVKGFKDFFGIRSPSKLMKQMGSYLGEGLGLGIEDSIGSIKSSIQHANDYIADNLGNVKAGLTIGENGGRGNQVVNAGLTINYNGNLNRKQVRKLEDDHYRNIKLRLKSEGAI